ncbi:Uncharacterized protein conserved in bacteria [Anaerococcus prevotii]|uniref:SH3 type 3 domain protein n=1 Tax=Anaerococcus prevotii (strain ATCC 9321 / DSM 20548 / JCM 6508 / NCTC 11806 / PC1) TaxID=525919 RepID=C7RG74_ANAPD|nr:SH3 domain-containing protein [Anaerococcus prevotii]ACV28485.1 SH3 type 3 domain protein [Anaerococcus prevotii DSM 20548]SUU94044.1 Uncharacterized protein conserved in bacteria [Anaerococcus prevotii]
MNKFTKYALAAALVLPSVFTFGSKEAKADRIELNTEKAKAVNVRSTAEEKNNVIGTINDENKSYEILGKANGWYRIDFEGKEAFVGTPWFNVTAETEVIAPANFRDEAQLSSNVISVLQEGDVVEVIEEADNGYVKVKFDGKEGYVYNNLLKSFKERNEKAQNKAKAPASNTKQASYQTYEEPTYTYTEEYYYEEPAEDYYYEQPAADYSSYQGDSNWAKEWIAQRESGGSYTAYNPAGGYYGRYQLNPSLVGYGASPEEQEAAADSYVYGRYGSWENAQAFWANNGWY